MRYSVLIITAPGELERSKPIWGTGGWLPAEDRIALDWYCLFRFMGFNVILREPDNYNARDLEDQNVRWLIIACDTTALRENFMNEVARSLASHSVVVLCSAGKPGSIFAKWCGVQRADSIHTGRTVESFHDASSCAWECRNDIMYHAFSDATGYRVETTINGLPTIISRQSGPGKLVVLADNPSELRDQHDIFSQIILRILIQAAEVPIAWQDWSGTLILRMDDPGSSEAVHNVRYTKPKLGPEEWDAINRELKYRDAHMSIGYVIGWVDDGDNELGELSVADEAARRLPGKVHPSPLVKYTSTRKGQVYDYVHEFNAIQELRKCGTAEVEMHGFTHVDPDRERWLSASDRYANDSWYREFGADAMRFLNANPEIEHPIDASLHFFKSYFGIKPTTFIAPGEVFTHEILLKALREGIMLVGSYYLAFRDDERFCWSQHICAPYLDAPDEKWFHGCLPVVGYFHDFDIAERGVDWFVNHLDSWQAAGAKRIVNFCDVNAALHVRIELQTHQEERILVVISNPAYPIRSRIKINLFFGDGGIPPDILVNLDDSILRLQVTRLDEMIGSVTLKS